MTKLPGFDCQSCGACCRTMNNYDKHYVRLMPDDTVRMSKEDRKSYTLKIKDDYGFCAAMRLNGTQCAALQGTIGKLVSCAIYESRPDICRRFEPNSELCMLAREEAGLGHFATSD